MSFLKRLFGGDEGGKSPRVAAESEYEGYRIRATPQKAGDQYRLCGIIEKNIDGDVKSHTLIRADLFMAEDQATEATMRKARQVIDEQGERIFER